MKTLRADRLLKRYRKRPVVNEASFEVAQGEVVGLLGPNGAGKTTSFNMVVGLIKPDQGRVTLGEHDLTSLPLYKRARLGIGYLPQEPSIFRNLTVYENFIAILEYLEPDKPARKRRAEKLIQEFGLQRVAGNEGASLSGGERRRVEIARTLLANPTHLLFDEPFAGIDPIAVTDLQTLVRDLKTRGIGVLITDHNVRETLSLVDRAYLIYDGKIVESGTPQRIAQSEIAKRVYLGEEFKL